MLDAGSRRRNLPAPPHVVAESLCAPDRDPARPWLHLLDDEQRPDVVQRTPELVVWSSLLPDDSRLGHYRKRLNELIHANLRHTYGQ